MYGNNPRELLNKINENSEINLNVQWLASSQNVIREIKWGGWDANTWDRIEMHKTIWEENLMKKATSES
jgi:hypothetical protein